MISHVTDWLRIRILGAKIFGEATNPLPLIVTIT